MTDNDELFGKYRRDRDRQTYERLVEAHRPLVSSVCRRLLRDPNDIDDVVQETFCKLAGNIDLVTGSLTGWLAATAQAASVDLIRREVRERRRRGNQSRVGASGASSLPIEHLATREAIRLKLHEAMLAMDPAARGLLIARFATEEPLRVLAGRLHASVATAHRRVAEAIQELVGILRDLGVSTADNRAVADHFGAPDALADLDGGTGDSSELRFAPDWRSAELTPLGAAAPPTPLLPGWSRPLRVGALISYDSTRVIGANGKVMKIATQVFATTMLPPAGLQLVAVVEPRSVHRGIVESTLRDHEIIGGLVEADDAAALKTLDVLILGINWSMTASIARAINEAVRGGMGLLNEYWTGSGAGACDDVNLRGLMLADSAYYAYHMPGQCGSPLSATVLREHPLLPGLKNGARMVVSGCGPAYQVMLGAQVLVAKDHLVPPQEHGISNLGAIQMPCYIVGQLGHGRVVVNHTWSLTPGRAAAEIIEHLSVTRDRYFTNLLLWLAGSRQDTGLAFARR